MDFGILAYLLAISWLSVLLTLIDKRNSKYLGARRVPEKTLFLLAFLGGSVAMYLTMKRIRHKTKHPTFMIGLPLIMLLQVLICVGIWLYFFK